MLNVISFFYLFKLLNLVVFIKASEQQHSGNKTSSDLISFRAIKSEEFSNKILKNGEYTLVKSLDGFTFILFDCDDPKYFFPKIDKTRNLDRPEVRKLPSVFRKAIQKVAYCDSEDQLWKSSTQQIDEMYAPYLAFKPLKEKLTFAPLNSLILKDKSVCEDYLKLLLHPGYFNKDSKPPIECNHGHVNDYLKKTTINFFDKTEAKTSTKNSQSKNETSSTKNREKMFDFLTKKKKKNFKIME
jgi:hypothetical protein